MELIPAFDPTTATSGSFIASTLQTGSQIIITNKSYVNMIFTFASGDQRPVLANDRRAFTFGGATALPGPTIKWQQQSIDYPQTINQLENLVFVEIYAPTEVVSEKYPSIIQRETLPTLIPYNIGAGVQSTGAISPNTTNHTIWPSSYYGVTVAPQGRGSVDGMGFDHFWEVAEGTNFTMLDLPGHYPTTGKTANDATSVSPSLMSIIPGPFSKSGLTPVDSATMLNGTSWALSSTLNWAGATNGFLLDMWVNIPSVGTDMYLFGDTFSGNTMGVAIEIRTDGRLRFTVGTPGADTIVNSTPTRTNVWQHLGFLWIPNTVGGLSIWVNGENVASNNTTGFITNTANIPHIASRDGNNQPSFGAIANVGLILTNPFGTQWGNNIVLARYLLGLQSLTTDIQNLWLTGFDIVTLAPPAATYQYSLSNLFLPSGLLYHNVSSTFDTLHIVQPGNIFMDFAVPQQTSPFIDHVRFPNPVTSDVINFMNFNDWVSTGPQYEANFYGFNLLGFS